MRPGARVRSLVVVAQPRAPTFLAAAAFELGSVLLPALLVVTLAATPAALGVVEGVAIGVGAIGQLVGGTLLAHHRARRRATDLVGFAGLAGATAAMAAAATAAQAGVLRAGAWLCAGLRLPGTAMAVSETADQREVGREFGLERGAEYLGAGLGIALAVVLVATLSIRTAIAVAIVPGALAVLAAYRMRPQYDPAPPLPGLREALRELRTLRLGGLLAGIAVLEAANISFTLLILRATKLLEEGREIDTAVVIAVALFLGYRIAGMASGVIGGRLIDAHGARVPLTVGAMLLLAAYVLFAEVAAEPLGLAAAFVLAGTGVGVVETAEHVAVARRAPPRSRAVAFGALSALQSGGRLFASVAAGVLWTIVSPTAGLLVTVPLLIAAPIVLVLADRRLNPGRRAAGPAPR